jgi:GT2 family glycosyltransferase
LFDALLRQSIERSAREAFAVLRPKRAATALRAVLGDLDTAPLSQTVRNLDKLWRSAPAECLGVLAPVYGRLLALEGKYPQAALKMLQRASAGIPDVDCEALKAHLLLELNLAGDARKQLDSTLARFSRVEGGLLWHVAAQLLRDPLERVGSQRSSPKDSMLDGRTTANRSILTGWARFDSIAERPPLLRARDQNGVEAPVSVNASSGGTRWAFELDLRKAGLSGGRIEVEAQLPNGSWQALPDSPLLLPEALGRRRVVALAKWQPQRLKRPFVGQRTAGVDVIIPVHDNGSVALACIESALASVANEAHIIVVDDASEDEDLALKLDSLHAKGQITLLRNPNNVGFVQSVNRGFAVHQHHDVVILNSDAQVHGDWLRRLRAHAYSADNVATVTPLSNRGSIASYPSLEGSDIEPTQATTLHELAARANDGASVQIPVGVGFCLYIRRDSLEAVGVFDADTFAVGYGEETDFCLRARQQGWAHLLAADTFVYHVGGVTFGGRRAALLERSERLLNLRYRGYTRYIARYLEADPLLVVRRQLDEQRLTALGANFVLLVTLALTGGVDHYVKQRCEAIRSRGQIPLVLRPIQAGDSSRCMISTEVPNFSTPNLLFNIPRELAALERLLSRVGLVKTEIQHFLHLDPRVIEAVRALAPYEVMLHDYSWICPRVTLINHSGRYCGEPAVEVCDKCVKRGGSLLNEKISVRSLRERSEGWLRGASNVVAPSRDTANRIRRHFAGLPVEVRAHAAIDWELAPECPSHDGITTVGLIGAIGQHKGFEILLACARDARQRRLPLRFVVIGYTQGDDRLQATRKVFVTGRYHQQELPHLLERERPDVILFPSMWPETWCYALDEAMGAGLPIVAFDIGALGERLRGQPGATLLPVMTPASEVNDSIMKRKQATATVSEGLRSSVQALPVPPGLYRFSVTEATPTLSAGHLRLPALHVGIAPGVAPGAVEFVSADTFGGWLFNQTDTLTVRVTGAGSTLLLTSVSEPDGAPISIKAERVQETEAAPVRVSASSSLKIAAHIRGRGDMSFVDVDWAGRVAPGLWIESFSVQPLRDLQEGDIEYKALTGSGFETPWLSEKQMCGTRGLSTPLLGFAIRLKSTVKRFDVEYRGYFQSGLTIGPVRNGDPCRSSVAGDPLEGMQIQVVRRRAGPQRRRP